MLDSELPTLKKKRKRNYPQRCDIFFYHNQIRFHINLFQFVVQQKMVDQASSHMVPDLKFWNPAEIWEYGCTMAAGCWHLAQTDPWLGTDHRESLDLPNCYALAKDRDDTPCNNLTKPRKLSFPSACLIQSWRTVWTGAAGARPSS